MLHYVLLLFSLNILLFWLNLPLHLLGLQSIEYNPSLDSLSNAIREARTSPWREMSDLAEGLRLYGSPTPLGPAVEPCDTQQSIPQAILLSNQDEWENALTEQARPGDVFLLRAGTYQATDKLWLVAGTDTAPIVIKPYNCEPVILRTSIRPNSHTVLAGLQVEAAGVEDTKWAIRVDGKNRGPLTDITLRNNLILSRPQSCCVGDVNN